MIPAAYTYIALLAGSLFFPLILSFDKKVAFYTRFPRLFPSILLGASIFLAWDIWFTRSGVWSFSEAHVLGIFWLGLPLEEWLFFLVVPYCCFFIYECLNAYFSDYLKSVGWILAGITWLFAGGMLVLFYDAVYTRVSFIGILIIIPFHLLIFRFRHFGRFFAMWLVHIIPLCLINGVLTGIPVVIYNDMENSGIRVGTIPIEDFFYSMLLLWIIHAAYEGGKQLSGKRKIPSEDGISTQ